MPLLVTDSNNFGWPAAFLLLRYSGESVSSGYNVAAPSSTSFSRLPYQNPYKSPRNTRYFGNCVNDKSARFNTLVASCVNRVRPAEGRGGRVYVGQCEAHSVTCDLAPHRDHTSEYSQHLQNPTVSPGVGTGSQFATVGTRSNELLVQGESLVCNNGLPFNRS